MMMITYSYNGEDVSDDDNYDENNLDNDNDDASQKHLFVY